jgi:hypothetical protein
MRGFMRMCAFLVLGVGLGYCSADYSMEQGLTHVSVRNGAWTIWPAAGSPDADPYTRAHFAATGHLPLTIFEAATFRADTDDSGAPLDQECEYRIEGTSLAARWWSLAAYRSNRSTIANAAERHAFNSTNLVFDSQGEFTIALASRARPGNWLPLAPSGRFYLSLSLFNPDTDLRNRIDKLVLPKIVKVGCA